MDLIVSSETLGKVCVITINRPDVRNAFDGVVAKSIASALIKFDKDPELYVAVLCGKGGTFCSGANLKVIVNGTEEEKLRIHTVQTYVSGDVNYDVSGPMGFSRLLLSKPVIACVQGYAVAGGLELACWCDLRVVEEDAIMGVFLSALGCSSN